MAVHPGIDGRGVVFSTASFPACTCSGDTAPPAGCPQMRTDVHPIASPGSTLCVDKHRTNTVVCFLPELDAQSSRLRRPAARRCVREQRWRGPEVIHPGVSRLREIRTGRSYSLSLGLSHLLRRWCSGNLVCRRVCLDRRGWPRVL